MRTHNLQAENARTDSVPTATKRLNTSHQAFTSIHYNLH